MIDLLVLSGVVVATSFVATFGIANRMGRAEPMTEAERQRFQLDALLDELGADELRDVARFSRDLCERRAKERSSSQLASTEAIS